MTYKFTNKDKLKTHIASVHEENKVKNQTIWTEKEVLDSTSQPEIIGTRAIPTQTKESIQKVSKRIFCELCDKKFNKPETFSKHMLKIHKKIIEVQGGAGKSKSMPYTNKEIPPIFNILTDMTLRSKAARGIPTKEHSNALESHIDKE